MLVYPVTDGLISGPSMPCSLNGIYSAFFLGAWW